MTATVRCSVGWNEPELPAWGTAARARFWLALEQPGPWGAKAATESHLDPKLGATLDRWCAERGGRLALVRRPGPHADVDGPRRVLIASHLSSGGWIEGTQVDDPASLPALLASWSDHDQRPDFTTPAAPALLVCTNGRRDRCCAIDGRPLVEALARRHPDQVWESNHLGGHRFAPTAVALPTGQTFARVTTDLGLRILGDLDAGTLTLADALHDRGRSHLDAPEQVLGALAHDWFDDPSPLALSLAVAPAAERGALLGVATHRDGRLLRVQLTREEPGGHAPESCGKPAVPLSAWRADILSD